MTNCQDNKGKHGRDEIILCDKSSSVFGRIVTIITLKLICINCMNYKNIVLVCRI